MPPQTSGLYGMLPLRSCPEQLSVRFCTNRVATPSGRGCPMIAIRAADDCGSLQLCGADHQCERAASTTSSVMTDRLLILRMRAMWTNSRYSSRKLLPVIRPIDATAQAWRSAHEARDGSSAHSFVLYLEYYRCRNFTAIRNVGSCWRG
jgi:hypothetical protein